MYKNIIFDVGGVLINFDPRGFLLDRFFNEALEERLYDLTFGSEEWQLLDANKITRPVANKRMLANAREYDCEFEVRSILEDWASMLTTRQKTAQIIAGLKAAGYHVYYLTNMPDDVFRQLRRRPFWKYFDGGIASCEVHINKPDTAIYRMLMAKYRLVYEETLFIDDSKANAQAAYNLGIAGILYKGNKSLLRALKACGVQPAAHSKRAHTAPAKKSRA